MVVAAPEGPHPFPLSIIYMHHCVEKGLWQAQAVSDKAPRAVWLVSSRNFSPFWSLQVWDWSEGLFFFFWYRLPSY